MRVTGFEPDVFRNEMRDGGQSTELEENLTATNYQFMTRVSVYSHYTTLMQLFCNSNECVYVREICWIFCWKWWEILEAYVQPKILD